MNANNHCIYKNWAIIDDTETKLYKCLHYIWFLICSITVFFSIQSLSWSIESHYNHQYDRSIVHCDTWSLWLSLMIIAEILSCSLKHKVFCYRFATKTPTLARWSPLSEAMEPLSFNFSIRLGLEALNSIFFALSPTWSPRQYPGQWRLWRNRAINGNHKWTSLSLLL